MEELKILVGMVADLPDMALWVVAFFFVYKVCIIGSIYGSIKFVTTKLVEWRTFVKPEVKPFPKEYDLKGLIANEDTLMLLVAQLARIKRRSYSRIEIEDVKKIESLIDQMLNKDKE
jgi:hypothetical protein